MHLFHVEESSWLSFSRSKYVRVLVSPLQDRDATPASYVWFDGVLYLDIFGFTEVVPAVPSTV